MQATKTPIGLIGLGNAGLALAAPLVRHFTLVGYDRSEARRQLATAAGVSVVGSGAEGGRRRGILLVSLPAPRGSLAAASELAEGALGGRLLVETSTVGPGDIARLQAAAVAQGASVVDAAIIGGVHKLAEGRTTFLVGAGAEDYTRAEPVLACAAEEIFHLGAPGAGMRAKLVNNAIAHTTMVMLLEGAALAAKAGVPTELFYKLMARESGLTRPLTHRFGERIRRQDFEGGMPTANARKDSALALELARELGVPLFTLQASHSVYEIAGHAGLDRLDYAAISRLWEQWLGIRFADAPTHSTEGTGHESGHKH